MKKEYERFQISQVGILIRENKCLILEFNRSNGERGHWGLPGGRLDEGEMGEAAFRREIKEELGFDEFEIHDVVDYDIMYAAKNYKPMPICGIASLIKNDIDEIRLSDEHHQFNWVGKDELDDYTFLWPNAKRMLKKGFEYNDLINKKYVKD